MHLGRIFAHNFPWRVYRALDNLNGILMFNTNTRNEILFLSGVHTSVTLPPILLEVIRSHLILECLNSAWFGLDYKRSKTLL